MVRGRGSVGILLGAALGCSGNAPLLEESIDSAPIVGGTTDTTSKAVFAISINDSALCTGSLIAPNLVLTARHCVAPLSSGDAPVNCASDTFLNKYPPSGFLVTSDANIRDGVAANALVGVVEVRTGDDDTFCGNDIALLFLDSNVPSSSSPTIEPRVGSMPMTGESFTAIGYGLNSANDTQGTSAGIRRTSMSNLEVGCVGPSECGQSSRIKTSEWAANAPICSGDSGGPALDAEGRVIGIASRSDEPCAVGLYSAVASWQDMIVEAGQDAAELGGYDPPAWAAGGATMAEGGASSGGTSMGGSAGSAGKGGGSGTGGSGGAGGSTALGGSSNAGTGGDSGTGGSGNTGNAGAGGRSAGKGGSAGRASAAGSAGSATTPVPDAGAPMTASLGDECTGACESPYVCYTSTGKPPGTCVPTCSVMKQCPDDYRCAIELGACIPVRESESSSDDDESPKSDSGCGCRVTPVSDATGSAWHALGTLALAAAAVRRRRRASPT